MPKTSEREGLLKELVDGVTFAMLDEEEEEEWKRVLKKKKNQASHQRQYNTR